MKLNEVFEYEYLQLPPELQVRLSSLPQVIQEVIKATLSESLQYFAKTQPPFGANEVTSITFSISGAKPNISNGSVIVHISKKDFMILQSGELAMIEAHLSQMNAVVAINFPGDGDRHDNWTSRKPLSRQIFIAIQDLLAKPQSSEDSTREDGIPPATIDLQDTPEPKGWRSWLRDIFG